MREMRPSRTSCAPSRPSRRPTTSGSARSNSASATRARGEARPHQPRPRRAQAPIDEITLKSARPALGGAARAHAAQRLEHKAAFEPMCAPGEPGSLRELEAKAMSIGSNPDGGYLVPPEIEQAIGRRLTAISPIRGIAGVRQISSNVYKKPFMTAGAGGRLGRRDRRAHADQYADARRAVVPGDGALRHAGGDRDAARGLRGQHRPVDRAGGRAGLRRAGRHRLRHRRRQQQAEGLPRLHHGRRRLVDLGQYRLSRDAASPPPSRRPTRPTCWSISSMR